MMRTELSGRAGAEFPINFRGYTISARARARAPPDYAYRVRESCRACILFSRARICRRARSGAYA